MHERLGKALAGAVKPIVGGVRAEPKRLMVKKQVEMQQEDGVGGVTHR